MQESINSNISVLKLVNKISTFFLLILLVSCFGVETKNPEKAYKYWSGSEIPKEIEIINGAYYQSPHFSLEYELFLKFKSSENWFNDFVEYNNLEIDTIKHDWAGRTELPKWFKPNKNYLIYSKDQNNEFERSRYFINPSNDICYIYETVGM